MAQRRMFSLKVIDTDNFLDMSPTAQLLYFHLAMRADDDGFVSNPKKIMKIASVPDDDMRVLIAKKYLIPFESGVCVIKDWKIHNYIQADRYQETQYLEEKGFLIEDENGAYLSTQNECIQNVSKMDTQVRLELGKVRLGKSIDSSLYDEVFSFWNSKEIVTHRKITPELKKQIQRSLKDYTLDEIKSAIDLYATVLEKGTPEQDKKYYWSHQWTLQDFLKKGLSRFIDTTAENYKKKIKVTHEEVFKIS